MKMDNQLTTFCVEETGGKNEKIATPPHPLPFQVGCDVYLFHIGSGKYLVINRQEGAYPKERLRICDYFLDIDPLEKNFVGFNLQQWVDLCEYHDIITETIEKDASKACNLLDISESQRRIHFGGNVFGTIKNGINGIDLRLFRLPPDDDATVDMQQPAACFNVKPTHCGIWLSYDEWSALIKLKEIVFQLIPSLSGMRHCAANHLNQMQSLTCSHCNPNGYHAWI